MTAHSFQRGDFARMLLDPQVRCQVINNRNWDQEYLVRYSDGFEVWVQDVELGPDGPDDDRGPESVPVEAGQSNVIPFPRKAAA